VRVPAVDAVVSDPVVFHDTVVLLGMVSPWPLFAQVPATVIVAIESVIAAPCVRVFPDATESVPAPDTVETDQVALAPIVRVYPDATDRVPDPPSVRDPHVMLAPIVSVYPEPTANVPEPVMFVGVDVIV